MKSNCLVEVQYSERKSFLDFCIYHGITLERVSYLEEGMRCIVSFHDYEKLTCFYEAKLLVRYDWVGVRSLLFDWRYDLHIFLFMAIFFFWLSSYTLFVYYPSVSDELHDDLKLYLESKGIKRLAPLLDATSLEEIQKDTLAHFDTLEWFEIQRNGMTYQISLQEKVIREEEEHPSYCHVVASRDGMVTRFIHTAGTLVVRKNQVVHAGDILISGDITLQDEVKNQVCALGIVYGEVWYSLSLSIPLIYEEKTFTGRTFYNVGYESGIYDYTLLRDKFTHYEEKKYSFLSLLGHSFYALQQKEFVYQTRTYTEEELMHQQEALVQETLAISLVEGEKVLYQKVLKKELNDSTMDVELFIVAERIIGQNE